MKRNLYKLLRIRDLFEELSRLDLERKALAVREAEEASVRQEQLARTSRHTAFRLLADTTAETASEWLTEIADAELLKWGRSRLLAIAQARRPAFESAREVLLACRLERLQVETLIAAASQAERVRRERREQRNVDDWFQSRAGRGLRAPRGNQSGIRSSTKLPPFNGRNRAGTRSSPASQSTGREQPGRTEQDVESAPALRVLSD